MKNKIRLRYAPSPTGYLHIGNTRTALMNFLFAKHYGGDFIIRIEDTDYERNVDGAIESQFNNLDWLGITHDESYLKPKKQYGEYIQSKKLDRYFQIALNLIDKGYAYKCYCTSEELEEEKQRQLDSGIVAPMYSKKCRNLINETIDKPFSIRFMSQENIDYTINDLVRGEVVFSSNEVGDFVVVKSNKTATYNFAVVVDDHDMEISHVVRGEEHISNTPKQIMIYKALKWDIPLFCHLSLIVDESKKKLSKRSPNAVFFIEEYISKGYIPESIFNYISLLGWSPKNENEIYSKEELIKIFTEDNFTKSPSTFDMNKMTWFSNQWMKKISDQEYLKFVSNFVNKSMFDFTHHSKEDIEKILLLFKKEISYGLEINDHLFIFNKDVEIKENIINILKEEFSDSIKIISDYKNTIVNCKEFTDTNISEIIKQLGGKYNIKGKNLYMPLRIVSTGSQHGPELAKTISLIGKENVLKNIELVLKLVAENE